MKKWITLITTMFFAISLVACGSSEGLSGKYNLSSANMFGIEMNYADIVDAGMTDSSLEFKGDGIVEMVNEGYGIEAKIDEEKGVILDEINELELKYEVDGDVITLVVTEGMEMSYTLSTSELWSEYEKQESTLGDMFGMEDDGYDEPAIDEFESPTVSIEMGSEWYGIMSVIYENGTYDEYDVWAFVGEDVNDIPYFEIYDTSSYDAAGLLASYYINLGVDYFEPILGEESFAFDEVLTEDDYVGYSAYLYEGSIYLTDTGYVGDDPVEITMKFREYGTAWDEAYESLPPSYDQYKSEVLGH